MQQDAVSVAGNADDVKIRACAVSAGVPCIGEGKPAAADAAVGGNPYQHIAAQGKLLDVPCLPAPDGAVPADIKLAVQRQHRKALTVAFQCGNLIELTNPLKFHGAAVSGEPEAAVQLQNEQHPLHAGDAGHVTAVQHLPPAGLHRHVRLAIAHLSPAVFPRCPEVVVRIHHIAGGAGAVDPYCGAGEVRRGKGSLLLVGGQQCLRPQLPCPVAAHGQQLPLRGNQELLIRPGSITAGLEQHLLEKVVLQRTIFRIVRAGHQLPGGNQRLTGVLHLGFHLNQQPIGLRILLLCQRLKHLLRQLQISHAVIRLCQSPPCSDVRGILRQPCGKFRRRIAVIGAVEILLPQIRVGGLIGLLPVDFYRHAAQQSHHQQHRQQNRQHFYTQFHESFTSLGRMVHGP